MHWNRSLPMTLWGKIIVGTLCTIPIIFMGIVIVGIYFCTALLERTNRTDRAFIGSFLEVSGNSIITDKVVLRDQDKTFWDSIKPSDSIFSVTRYGNLHKEYAYEYRDQVVPIGTRIKFIKGY
jgi:hypothetical protein